MNTWYSVVVTKDGKLAVGIQHKRFKDEAAAIACAQRLAPTAGEPMAPVAKPRELDLGDGRKRVLKG